MQRRATFCLFVMVSVFGCSGKKKPASLVEIGAVASWASKNGCAQGTASAADTLPGAQFSCVKTLGECGCRAVVSALSKAGTGHADTVQILIANCRRDVGAQAAKDISTHLLDSLAGMDLDEPLHDDAGDAPTTAASVTRYYEDRDRPERETMISWSKDVFADGKPQRTETYKLVFSVPHTAVDHKMTWTSTPVVTSAPPCASHGSEPEDMARIPSGPALSVRLRCPPAAREAHVPAFEIDRHLVTCEQYAKCVDAHVCSEEPGHCFDTAVVSHHSAETYCGWRRARLPTLHEWERAVRGADADLYPTGAAWDPVAGCRVPTAKNAPGGLVRCENTNVDGVTYYVLDKNGEWTSDNDCMDVKNPTQREPVALMLGIEVLDRSAPVPEDGREQFRCSRPLEAQ